MNYLDTTKNGGHPLYLEDLGFIQDAYKEAIAGITQGLGTDSYILSGCQKTAGATPNTWNISAGFVVLDGEVFKVGAHTVNYISVNDPLYFNIHNATIYPSPAIYHDTPGDEFDVHHRRTAIVTSEVTEWPLSLPTIPVLLTRSQTQHAFKIPCGPNFSGEFYGRVIHGFFYLFGSCSSINSHFWDMKLLQIPSKYTPFLLDSNVTSGELPLTNEHDPLWSLTSRHQFASAIFKCLSSAHVYESTFFGELDLIIDFYDQIPAPRDLEIRTPIRFSYVPPEIASIKITIPMGAVMWPIKI